MNISSFGLAAPNKRPVMSGTLSAIPFAEAVLSVDKIIESAVVTYVNKLRSQLVERMVSDEDWRPLIPYINMSLDGLDLNVSVDHPMATVLEYGTPDRPMKPLVRPFMQTVADDMAKVIERKTKRELG